MRPPSRASQGKKSTASLGMESSTVEGVEHVVVAFPDRLQLLHVPDERSQPDQVSSHSRIDMKMTLPMYLSRMPNISRDSQVAASC